MTPALTAALVATINGAFSLWRVYANKPADWRPTEADISELLAQVDAATPEAEREAARARLNLPTDVEPLRETPQAPV
jgi:hypothetical protein